MGSWKGRGNQYIQFVRVLYCKLPANGKQLPAFPLQAVAGIEPRPQRWEARVLPLCHLGHVIRFEGHCINVCTKLYFKQHVLLSCTGAGYHLCEDSTATSGIIEGVPLHGLKPYLCHEFHPTCGIVRGYI